MILVIDSSLTKSFSVSSDQSKERISIVKTGKNTGEILRKMYSMLMSVLRAIGLTIYVADKRLELFRVLW